MTEPKNIIIKVKYSAPESPDKQPPKMITEWNFKRIGIALGIVALLTASVCALWTGETEQNRAQEIQPEHAAVSASPKASAAPKKSASSKTAADETPSLPSPAAAEAKPKATAPSTPRAKPAPPALQPADAEGRIRRAALAYRIVDKEAVDLIGSNVEVRRGKTVPVFYFVEARGKNGQTLFHEWRKKGKLVMRYPLAINAERWRTSSQRMLDMNDTGPWSVRTVDEKGILMNELTFTVSVK